MLSKLKIILITALIGNAAFAQNLSTKDKLNIISHYNMTIAKQQWDSTTAYYDSKMSSFLPQVRWNRCGNN